MTSEVDVHGETEFRQTDDGNVKVHHSRHPVDSLIERLEKATGPDRGLDLDIKFAMAGLRSIGGYRAVKISTGERVEVDYLSPDYTGSIDAALTLVPEGSPWTVADHDDNGKFFAMVDDCEVLGATPAIALANAALRARAAIAAKTEA